jgi:hypothetical protein
MTLLSELTDPAVYVSEETVRRVCGEFLEMPGLCVTCRQAQRLWGLGEQQCRQLLDALVEAHFLRRRDPDLYSRLTEGQFNPRTLTLMSGKCRQTVGTS